jgi:sugar lactone lactonase YvrE
MDIVNVIANKVVAHKHTSHKLATALFISLASTLAGCGGGGGSTESPSAPPPPASVPTSSISVFAGAPGGVSGTADGISGRLGNPSGLAVDKDGNVLVADRGNCSIRKIISSSLSTVMGNASGCVSFTRDQAVQSPLQYALGNVSTDRQGNIYFSVSEEVWKMPPGGAAAPLPNRLTVDAFTVNDDGDIFFSRDGFVIKITADGNQTALATTYIPVERFSPISLAAGPDGAVYFSDRSEIRKIAKNGVLSTLAGSSGDRGFVDGVGANARFGTEIKLAADTLGNVYAADGARVRKITPTGVVTTLAGSIPTESSSITPVDGIGASARFTELNVIAADKLGNVFVAGLFSNAVRRISPYGVVTTIVGSLTASGSTDGIGQAARFLNPAGLAIDSNGSIYLADSGNRTIRKLEATGLVTTVAGAVGLREVQDGIGSAVRFDEPVGMAIDTQGKVYVSERFQLLIRQLSSSSEVKTVVGLRQGGRFDFRRLISVAIDRNLNIYTADSLDSITKFSAAGTQTVLPCGDACIAVAATTDASGTVYFATQGSIRRVSPEGVVTVLAGDAAGYSLTRSELVGSRDGVGADARFYNPGALAIDGLGNVFVADTGNHTIRKVTPAGVVTTIVGRAGISGVMTGALPGLLNAPKGIAINATGNIFVTTENAVVKIVQ